MRSERRNIDCGVEHCVDIPHDNVHAAVFELDEWEIKRYRQQLQSPDAGPNKQLWAPSPSRSRSSQIGES